MIAPVCSGCGVTFDIGRRTSRERIDDAAVKAGWILGLPRQALYCPACDRLPVHRVGANT